MYRNKSELNPFFRKELDQLYPFYHPLKDEKTVRLSLMESPYILSKFTLQKILSSLNAIEINRYPDPEATLLTEKTKKFYQIEAGVDLLFANGLMELIQLLCWAFSFPGAYALFPAPGFFLFKRFSVQAHLKPEAILLDDNFDLPLDLWLNKIAELKPKIIFIDYPNNPTGKLFNADTIEKIITASQAIVVIDEAYYPYSSATWLDKIPEYKNLVVLRSFSKLGFAGLRLGFLAAHTDLVEYLKKILHPFTVNSLTQQFACRLFSHMPQIYANIKRTSHLKKMLFQELKKIEGIEPFPSEANFILFRLHQGRAANLYEYLINHNISINLIDGIYPKLDNCLRVGVGTEKDNEAFLTCVKNWVGQHG